MYPIRAPLRRSLPSKRLQDSQTLKRDRTLDRMSESLPITYVIDRNTIFLSFGIAGAETLNADGVYISVNTLDYSGYRDCRPHYIQAMQEVFRLGAK
ncbi:MULTISPECIES: 7-cyano-7-deazaguanine synthase [unclassified Microcoleus]|uniref:7-cyano-7-deazaguanine synthase n=1 Tax=unclassified Microcoleus TaxID=2642155 RepID=UPI0040409590